MPVVTETSATAGLRARTSTVDWKANVALVAGVLLGVIYLVSGLWKLLQPYQAGEVLEQAKVHAGFGVTGAVALGILETYAAALLFTPKYRRWGGLLGSALMVFFIGWIAYYYSALVGKECSCFPIIKRTVGPGFFLSDGIFLLLGVLAFAWSRPVLSRRGPAVIFACLVLAGGASLGLNAAMRSKVQVPNPVVVNGKPADLTHGKVFLFFYDPQCSHCLAAAKFMSTLNWGSTEIVGIPTQQPQFAKYFLEDTHFRADTSLELEKLKKNFPFVDPPYGVALNDGRVKETFAQAQFNEPLPAPDLKKLGFVE